ncbi:hypothetical protein MBEHAL_1219 [Halarchaeum acidiphilum MH1-52-1]|uniref:Uncharacterized protein n=1 Tax=Halarchaeum acidiphilum MH1-52-1 TaxID=1261545 RepID=U3A495_9EURY|nr:hypothetical protein MBEHAL_1219 [Halarchaeum acidiphilum MH1-52-1]
MCPSSLAVALRVTGVTERRERRSVPPQRAPVEPDRRSELGRDFLDRGSDESMERGELVDGRGRGSRRIVKGERDRLPDELVGPVDGSQSLASSSDIPVRSSIASRTASFSPPSTSKRSRISAGLDSRSMCGSYSMFTPLSSECHLGL